MTCNVAKPDREIRQHNLPHQIVAMRRQKCGRETLELRLKQTLLGAACPSDQNRQRLAFLLHQAGAGYFREQPHFRAIFGGYYGF